MSEKEITVKMNRDFKGIWIPREIWFADGLSPSEKILWAEIHSLHDREKGGCYASNDYLMQFMGIRERRLQEMISNLKSYGLIVQVSFNGRERVIKAVIPPEGFIACRAEVQESAPLGCGKVHLSDAGYCTPHLYIENSIVTSIDSPPIPPQIPDIPVSTEVDEKKVKNSSKKKVLTMSEFVPEAKPLAEQMVIALHQANPDWLIPKNLYSIMRQVHEMIVDENRDPVKIMDVFMWTVNDNFWMDKLCKPNPAKYLRDQFGQLAGKMNAPAPKKERKFLPSSDQKRAYEAMEEMVERSI